MRTIRLLVSAALGLTLVIALAAPALGAPAATTAPKSASTSTPVDASAGGPIEVQIWPGQGGKTAIITAVEVDANTKLPVTVRIPVTPGSTVEWAGEVLGGTAEGDIQQPFKLVQGQGGQFAEFKLTKSHRGQIDALGFPVKVSGDEMSVSIGWVQSASSPLTSFAVRVPANVSKVKITPKPSGNPVASVSGEQLYSLGPKAYKLGEKQTVTVSFSTAVPVEPAPGSEFNPVLIGLGVALAVAVVAMIVLVRRQSAERAAKEFDEDESDAEAPISEDESDAETPASDDDRPYDEDDEPDLNFD